MTTIVAHRGASHDKPENTLAAIAEAWRQNADAMEADVRQSHDGHAVLSHDADTKRCGNHDQPIAEQTVAELQQRDVGEGEPVPTLADALRDAPRGRDWFLDIKCDASIINAVRLAIDDADFPYEQVVILSGDDEVLTGMQQAIPGCRTFVLGALSDAYTTEDAIDQVTRTSSHGVDLAANNLLDGAAAKRIIDAGLQLSVWTINDAALAERMIAIGATMITTDMPGEMRRWLRD